MDTTRVRKLYGQNCQVVVRCGGCGRSHTVSGLLAPGRRSGDVTVDGRTYPLSDLITIAAEAPVMGVRRTWPAAVPLAGLAWAMMVCLQRLSVRQRRTGDEPRDQRRRPG